ncbi:MAG: hypothetical protein VX588_04860, partial [Verrucomicrobiota bacterium]|nr:hypothetical protein [Verrucomicrobiota bacterium]
MDDINSPIDGNAYLSINHAYLSIIHPSSYIDLNPSLSIISGLLSIPLFYPNSLSINHAYLSIIHPSSYIDLN